MPGLTAAKPAAGGHPRRSGASDGCIHSHHERLFGLRAAQDAACARVTRGVPAAEAVDAHAAAGVRRVDETAAPDVDADVADAVEEDKVAGLERAPADMQSD